ncbi:MAG: hypothetical protein QXN71_03040 [Candidatus Aenigmatarchaeota archaeon]
MPKQKDKKVEDIPEEENIITPEEFDEIEKRERKGLRGIFSKKPKESKIEAKEREPEPKGLLDKISGKSSEDEILMSIEKINAKIETMEGLRQVTEEKISRLSEEIGELRSAILEKEKVFNQMETGFTRIKEMFEEVQPKKIRAELDKKEDAIEKLAAKVESFDAKISDIKKNMADVVSVMEKVKDIKNIIALSATITKKMEKIEEDKKEVTKTASKIESMFSELSEKMAEFHQYRDKIEFSSDSMHDLMKSIDMLEAKVENSVSKDDFRKLDDRFEQIERDLNDRIQAIKDIVDDLVESLRRGGSKELLAKEGKSRIDEINRKLSEIKDYEKSMKALKEEFEKFREEKTKEISALVSEIQKIKEGFQVPISVASKPEKKSEKPPVKEKPMTVEVPRMEQKVDDDMSFDGISNLMEQCNRCIDNGDIEEAKRLYSHILSIYESIKNGRDYPRISDTYNKIKRIYYRLQIYR